MTAPHFPDAVVVLTGTNGNAFAILGRVSRALRDHGATPETIVAFQNEAMAGTYDHLLATCMKWVDVR